MSSAVASGQVQLAAQFKDELPAGWHPVRHSDREPYVLHRRLVEARGRGDAFAEL